jgi:hypothetical protein
MAMNARTKIALGVAGLALTIPQGAAVAKAPDAKAWTGSWHLNLDKSKFSSADVTPKKDDRTYSVSGNRITMHSNSVTGAGKAMKWSYSATTDGKWARVTGNPNADHIALTLVSGREIKSETRLKGKPSATADATVSDDGKQITVHRSILTAKGGPTDDTLVYDRTK